MAKFYHELTIGERFDIYNMRVSWDRTAKKHPQPPWCGHTNAVDGLLGCDDLVVLGRIKSEEDCENCPFLRGDTYYD